MTKHEELYKLLKGFLHETEEDGWYLEKTRDDLTMHSKPMNDLSIGCYRIIDSQVQKGKSAKKMADHWYSMREAEMKVFDPSIKSFQVLSEKPFIVYQANSLPWPLASREFVVERQRFSDDEGEFIVTIDAEWDGAPSESGAVKGRSVINSNIFLQVEDGVRCARIVQIDPAGSIPSFVVNSKASDFMTDVAKMRSFPG